MANWYTQGKNEDEYLLMAYEGPKVGMDPDIAAEITRAVVAESGRLGDIQRFYILSVTLARNSILLRVKLYPKQMDNPLPYLTELKAIMGGIIGDIYTKRRMGIKT